MKENLPSFQETAAKEPVPKRYAAVVNEGADVFIMGGLQCELGSKAVRNTVYHYDASRPDEDPVLINRLPYCEQRTKFYI